MALSADGNQIAYSSMYFLYLGRSDNLADLKEYDFSETSFAGDNLLFNAKGNRLLGAGQNYLFAAELKKGELHPIAASFEPYMLPHLLAFHNDRIYTALQISDPHWDTGCLPDSRPLASGKLTKRGIVSTGLLTSMEACHHLKRFSVTAKGIVYIAKDDPENICRTFIHKNGKTTQIDTPEHFRMESSVGDLGIFSDFKEQKYRYGLFKNIENAEQFPFVPRPKEILFAKKFTSSPDESLLMFHALDSNRVQSLWIADVESDSIGEFRRVVQLNEGEEIHSASLSNRNIAVITSVKRDRALWVGTRSFHQKPNRLIVTKSLAESADYQEISLKDEKNE